MYTGRERALASLWIFAGVGLFYLILRIMGCDSPNQNWFESLMGPW